MGQKVNPNIFRLGISKTWKTKFFEKKNQELPLYIFKDLEIKNYIERFLEKHCLILHDYRQHYSNSTLNLYISYFVTPDFVLKKTNNRKLILINASNEKRCVTGNVKVRATLNPSTKLDKAVDLGSFHKIKKYLKANQRKDRHKSSQPHSLVTISNNSQKGVNPVFNQLLKVLNLFTNNKLNITINLCCVNKDLNFLKFSQTKKFSLLQKFRNATFLKEGIELLFHVVHNKNSANLLARFIALQLKKTKRQKLFFSFLKQTLSAFISSSFSEIKGVKIIVRGRLNGVPRAKHKIISVGDIPVQSINEKLDYAQTTVHNSSGSYGVKIWILAR